VIYDPNYKGQVTVPDNPIQIADAALYLSHKNPGLGIKDPYELTAKQLDAAVALLKKQQPLIKKYWALASDEIELFKNGDAVVGAAWPYQTNTLKDSGAPVDDTIPKEGATGWLDTWMLSTKSAHVNCAYMWMKWASTPKVQAQQAVYFGETPASSKACSFMGKKLCTQYHANAPASYFKKIKFWKTPRTDCGNGGNSCTDYTTWQQKWQEVKG
jgi:putative spermidine/putrescine transport system substrate-binding protein